MSEKIKNLDELEQLALSRPKQTVALAAANSEEALLAVEYARQKGILDAHLVGDLDLMKPICEKNGIDLGNYQVTDVKDPKEAAKRIPTGSACAPWSSSAPARRTSSSRVR